MLPIHLDPAAPLQRQIYGQLRDAILHGQLPARARLPASRQLAAELGISRNSVLGAYEQLTAEGYLTSRAGAGTFVASVATVATHATHTAKPTAQRIEEQPVGAPVVMQPSRYTQRIQAQVSEELFQRKPRTPLKFDFAYGEPAYADLPMPTWARIVGRTARQLNQSQLGYAPHAGITALRTAVAGYLARARGVHCNPEQVVIVQGTQEAIDLSVRLLIDPDDQVVLENPHYRGFRRCLLAAGANIRTVPVDDMGLCTDALADITGAKLACITPSHQFPLGGILPVQRRLTTLAWAHQQQTVILEDDYDGEFRYQHSPVPSLQSLDTRGCVIYVGTSSKIFFPSLRIGWMVVPEPFLPDLLAIKAMADTWPSTLEQLAFSHFINEGHLERHIHRVRNRLAAKRAALLDAIKRHLGARANVIGSQAGLHVVVRLANLRSADLPDLIRRCREHHTGIYSAAPFYLQPDAEATAEIILGYASLTLSEIAEGVQSIAAALDEMTRC